MKGPRTVLVTVASRARQVDAVADADVPLHELVRSLRDVLGLAPGETAVTIVQSGDVAAGGRLGDAGGTLTELGVVDGDMVVFHPEGQPPRLLERPAPRQPAMKGDGP